MPTNPIGGGQIGRSIPRLEAREKVTGRAEYTHLMRLPGMLHGKIFRSTVPHGRIKSVDTSAAKKIPGVFRVITAADVVKVIPDPYYGPAFHDQPILAMDKLCFVGEPVAVDLGGDAVGGMLALTGWAGPRRRRRNRPGAVPGRPRAVLSRGPGGGDPAWLQVRIVDTAHRARDGGRRAGGRSRSPAADEGASGRQAHGAGLAPARPFAPVGSGRSSPKVAGPRRDPDRNSADHRGQLWRRRGRQSAHRHRGHLRRDTADHQRDLGPADDTRPGNRGPEDQMAQ